MESINLFIENIKERNIMDVLIAIAIVIVFYMVSSLFSKIVMKLFKIKGNDKEKIKNSDIYKALKSIFMCAGLYIALLVLNLPENWFSLCSKIIRVGFILNIARAVAALISPESKLMKTVGKNEKIAENKTALNTISKIIKVILYIIAGFMIVADFGYDLSGLITGLGLSSVVIALAAQELVGNLISGMAIASDKPFQIGDYITVGTYAGTVIDIKFRCTKIKTAQNTIVTIQNSKILNEYVVNSSKIENRRYDLNLRLPLYTEANVLTGLLESIRLVLYSNTSVIANSLQVNITTIEPDAIIIAINLYVDIVDYAEFLKFQTNTNLSIIRLLEEKGIKLAHPGRDLYFAKQEETNH